MKLDTLASETENLEKKIDRLDDFSRQDNQRFFGLGPEAPAGSFSVCARKVVAALNDVRNPVKH